MTPAPTQSGQPAKKATSLRGGFILLLVAVVWGISAIGGCASSGGGSRGASTPVSSEIHNHPCGGCDTYETTKAKNEEEAEEASRDQARANGEPLGGAGGNEGIEEEEKAGRGESPSANLKEKYTGKPGEPGYNEEINKSSGEGSSSGEELK
jgi:hypothetical protein